MLKLARAALFAMVPAELIVMVLLLSGVALPRPLLVAGETALAAVLLLEIATATYLIWEKRRDGAGWPDAFRNVQKLVPNPVRRVIGFDTKGLVSVVLLVAGRRHGVPKGAVALPYSGAQTTLQLSFLFAMLLETAVVELLLRGINAPEELRAVILVIDLYSILVVLAVIAACVTRPHVLSDDELRVRYGAFFDLRVPRGSISAVRVARDYNESGLVRIRDGKLSVAVAAQTNVIVELDAPIAVVRPLGGRATARTIRFYADDPAALTTALSGAAHPDQPLTTA